MGCAPRPANEKQRSVKQISSEEIIEKIETAKQCEQFGEKYHFIAKDSSIEEKISFLLIMGILNTGVNKTAVKKWLSPVIDIEKHAAEIDRQWNRLKENHYFKRKKILMESENLGIEIALAQCVALGYMVSSLQ